MQEPTTASLPGSKLPTELQLLADAQRTQSIVDLFAQEPARVTEFGAEAAGWHLDFSRHLLNRQSRDALLSWAEQAGLSAARDGVFDGRHLNSTEDRAVLHTLLRAQATSSQLQDEFAAVGACRRKMAAWVERVSSGEHRGHSGARITTVVNLGIGGSDLGPRMVTEALRPFHQPALQVRFCANIDPTDLATTLQDLEPSSTLFIICSKTLRTEETLHNAQAAMRWLLDSGAPATAIGAHFLAVSTNLEAAAEMGIPSANILPLWDWVGGRYSLWSAIGWSIAFAVGNQRFDELLAGAHTMDEHFRTAPLANNLPVLMSLLEIWYVNFMQAQTCAVIPYDHNLRRLPAFLQQLSMESNGKRVNLSGAPLAYTTAPILWGDEGSNGQHSFHQLLHQGKLLCPVDFILPLTGTQQADPDGHRRLVANCISQAQALLQGRDEASALQSLLARGISEDRARDLAAHLVVPGNRPSSTLSCDQLSPRRLGALLALYEHKTFSSGYLWQINSFDQWGVELGKELGVKIYCAMENEKLAVFDPSTNATLEKWREQQ